MRLVHNPLFLSPGKAVPERVNMVVEIPTGGPPVKYEVDAETGLLFVDRLRQTAMHYPCNYGFIPRSRAPDGDPTDVLLITSVPILSGAVISVRPLGVLHTIDQKGVDAKIVAVPDDRTDAESSEIRTLEQLPRSLRDRLAHFFAHYKDLEGEAGRWSRSEGWGDVAEAHRIIREDLARWDHPD